MGQQYEEVTFEAKPRRWDSLAVTRVTPEGDIRLLPGGQVREVYGYIDMDTPIEYTMTQANFATRRTRDFQRWVLDVISRRAFPKRETVAFGGGHYRPKDMRDEIAEIYKRS